MKKNAGVALKDEEIIAAHRIPGENGKSRPIWVKIINNDVKSRVMKKRYVVKDYGFRLGNDVTKANVSLIKRLSEHKVTKMPSILMDGSTNKLVTRE